jgi:hypothetical protein
MNSIKIRPTWCWKPFDDVPELLEIQKEFQHIQQLQFPGLNQNDFLYVDKDILEHHAPVYCEFLKRIKLYKRRSDTALISSYGSKPFPIHIDGEDWENRCFALNLPVYNCDQSYTVWYKGTRSGLPGGYTDPNDNRSDAILYDEATAVEIDRMPASTPAIVNISVPHRPVTLHGKLRYLVSTRFGPELFDIVRKYNTR